jgi:hypothetical protein
MEGVIQNQQEFNTQIVTCPVCHNKNSSSFYFCPNCGKQLHEKPLSLSFWKQLGIYALSLLLPPLGLWPAVKYLRQKSIAAKLVGVIAIILTIISTVVTLYYFYQIMSQMGKTMNIELNKLQGY